MLAGWLMAAARRRAGASGPPPDLLSNLILSLDLEEASGNALDSSGNGYTFTDNNTVTQTTGATGGYNARSFASASSESFTRVGAGAEVTVGDNEWAAHMWAYRNGSTAYPIFGKGNNITVAGSTNRSYMLKFNATTLEWECGTAAGSTSVIATAGAGEFPNTTWVPVLVWHNPIADVIGIKVGSNTAVTTAITSGGLRSAGSNAYQIGGPSPFLNGALAALRVWRGAGVIAQIVDNTAALTFLNAQQRRHSELT